MLVIINDRTLQYLIEMRSVDRLTNYQRYSVDNENEIERIFFGERFIKSMLLRVLHFFYDLIVRMN